MFRKISTIVLVVVVVATGVFAFLSLRYWENSVRIFQINSDQPDFRGGRGGFDGRKRHERPYETRSNFEFGERRNLPDSLRNKFNDERDFRTLPDSVRQSMGHDGFRGDRGSFRGGHGGDRRGGDFRGGSRINLGRASGFLAVFALFTLITIGIDKGFKRFRNRKNTVR